MGMDVGFTQQPERRLDSPWVMSVFSEFLQLFSCLHFQKTVKATQAERRAQGFRHRRIRISSLPSSSLTLAEPSPSE